jgi:hypothetical protein
MQEVIFYLFMWLPFFWINWMLAGWMVEDRRRIERLEEENVRLKIEIKRIIETLTARVR